LIRMDNEHWHVGVDESDGSLRSLVIKGDKFGMNWLPDRGAEPWIPAGKTWGLGFVTLRDRKYGWEKGERVGGDSRTTEHRYRLVSRAAADGGAELEDLTLTVRRGFAGETLEEEFLFRNSGERYLLLDEIGIYSTFYDVYPIVSGDALSRRAHMHIWAGGGLSYVKGVRMSAEKPHLAMVTIAGDVGQYQVEEKQSSNQRGIIALTGDRARIAAGKTYAVKRAIFAYEDERDFHRKVTKYSGYPYLEFDLLAAPVGERVQIAVREAGDLEKIVVGENTYAPREGEVVSLALDGTGTIEGKVFFGGKQSAIRWYGIPAVDGLLNKRAKYIVSKQRLNDDGDIRNGAFLPYDREADRLIKTEDIEDTYGSVPDRNDARERVGMGAFLAAYYRLNPGEADMEAMDGYYRFIRTYIIGEDYGIWDSCFRERTAKYYGEIIPGTKDMTFRGFNYFFVGAYLLNLYRLTRRQECLTDLVGVIDKYFDKFSMSDLSFGLNPDAVVRELKDANRPAEAERLSRLFKDKAYAFVHMQERYEPSEVNYEQSTVAGVVMYLLDSYLLTEDPFILEGAIKHLSLLESFDGCQPDFRMYGVGLRHWDGYWFGKHELWGDTLPHQWSTLSAYAYYRYYRITSDRSYYEKSMRCLNANLSLFREDGAADYVFIYPHKVNGRPGHAFDPISNDQDWALYYYLEIVGEALVNNR